MFRSLFLAAALMAFTPLAANAGEITLLPSIKLQIGDRDHYGNYWDGGHWRDRDYWHRNYEWRKTAGGVMIMATTVAGISVKPMSVAIVKAGAIVMIIAEKAADMGIAIKHVGRIRRSAPHPPVVPAPTQVHYNPSAVPTNNQIFSATTSTTITQPVCFTRLLFTRSPISLLSLVKISSGTSARAIPKLNST